MTYRAAHSWSDVLTARRVPRSIGTGSSVMAAMCAPVNWTGVAEPGFSWLPLRYGHPAIISTGITIPWRV